MTPRKRLFDKDKFWRLIAWWSGDGRSKKIDDFVDSEISRNVHEALDEVIRYGISSFELRACIEYVKSRYPAKKEKT